MNNHISPYQRIMMTIINCYVDLTVNRSLGEIKESGVHVSLKALLTVNL